jgi:glycosyltransferase involved in cell wall biosynthesis
LIDEIVHVSASLRQDDGGAAHLGRLLGRVLRRHCARRGLAFRGLHLPASDGHPALDGYRSFSLSRWRLGLHVFRRGRRRGRSALLFDHLGPARLQGALPRGLRGRYAATILGVDVWRELAPSARAALSSACRVVAISHETVRRARPFLPADCAPVVVHPGIDPPSAGGAPDAALLAGAGERFVLIVGRLAGAERYKGHDELLAAFAALDPAIAPRLVIAGDGSDRARLETKAAELGLGGRVLFAGAVDGATLEALYRRSALFAMPSAGEGFGLVFLEAMAAGKPCVALEASAPAEIVVHGETGLLVPAKAPAALAAALRELLARPELARRLGEAGRERYRRDFTFDAFERRLAPVLDALTGA